MRLGIVSPSSAIDAKHLDDGCDLLQSRGFQTKVFPHARDRWGSFAGHDADRLTDLHAAFADPEVDAVLCSRGGYGCSRLVLSLDLEFLARNSKPFLGYSDITTLHLALAPVGIPCFHAPMVISFAEPKPEWVYESFERALAGCYEAPAGAPAGECAVPGTASGVVTGGCMTMLADSLGVAHGFRGAGAIVLIEDIHEKPHRIDAMLTHILNSGALCGAVGIVVGEMTETNELAEEPESTWQRIFMERMGGLGVPMIFNYPFGHVDGALTIPLGRTAVIDADRGKLNYLP